MFGRMQNPATMWVGPRRAEYHGASVLLGSGEELQCLLPLPTLSFLPSLPGPSESFGQRRPTGPNLQQSCLGSREMGLKPPQQTLHCFWEILTRNFISKGSIHKATLPPDFSQLVCDYACKVCLLGCNCRSPRKSPGEPMKTLEPLLSPVCPPLTLVDPQPPAFLQPLPSGVLGRMACV